ncbi:PEP-CTERM sorting domain-containing protein [Sphingomonas sp.]|uniref:PEP-CTERM sorting domain-containing protein n=1 Tax=Sphingomonas sp. TaxID=28214 RepID=UPI001B19B46E|nr:PEP-CTERM sorting domain-containing protein [Sphingomonas sp.]MBO9715173.1 PEP-CTERM sorting domain-containing protein [Sphingomonas sp.]
MRILAVILSCCLTLMSSNAGATTYVKYEFWGGGYGYEEDSSDFPPISKAGKVKFSGWAIVPLGEQSIFQEQFGDEKKAAAGASSLYFNEYYSDALASVTATVELFYKLNAIGSAFPDEIGKPKLQGGTFSVKMMLHYWSFEGDGVITGARVVPYAGPAEPTDIFEYGASLTSVPEPETWLMLLLGVAMTGWAMRRRRSGGHSGSRRIRGRRGRYGELGTVPALTSWLRSGQAPARFPSPTTAPDTAP